MAGYEKNVQSIYENTIQYLYYLAPLDNLSSILKFGILCRNEVKAKGIPFMDLSDSKVQDNRREKTLESNDKKFTIHDCVPLYFTSNTPSNHVMATRTDKFILIRVKKNILITPDVHYFVSNGNMGCSSVAYGVGFPELDLPNWQIVYSDEPGYNLGENKRFRMAEALIVGSIPTRFIDCIIVLRSSLVDSVNKEVAKTGITIPVSTGSLLTS